MRTMTEQQRVQTVLNIKGRIQENFEMGRVNDAFEKQVALQKQLFALNDPKQRMKNYFRMQMQYSAMGFSGKDAQDMAAGQISGTNDELFRNHLAQGGLTDKAAQDARMREIRSKMGDAASKSNSLMNSGIIPSGAALAMQSLIGSGGGATSAAFTNVDAYAPLKSLEPMAGSVKELNDAIQTETNPTLTKILSAVQTLREGIGGNGLISGLMGGSGLVS